MTEAARELLAGQRARVLVDAELQPARVHVIGDTLDAVRELHRVRHEIAAGVPVLGHPAVVDVDVVIACVLQPGADEQVRGLLDEGFGDVAGEGVPVVPAQRGSAGESVVQGGRGRDEPGGNDHGGGEGG